MDYSTAGFPVQHQLLELPQTHVLWVSDAIQPSHLLSSPSLLPSIFPSIRVFSNESVLHIRWIKYWSFSCSIRPSNEHSELISFRMDWLQTNGLWRVFFNTPVQKHQFFGAQLSLSEKAMATHSSILAWEIPWTEEPGVNCHFPLQGIFLT